MKLKWTKDSVLSAAAANNANVYSNDFIVTIRDTKLYVPVVTLSGKGNQELSKILSKGCKISVY